MAIGRSACVSQSPDGYVHWPSDSRRLANDIMLPPTWPAPSLSAHRSTHKGCMHTIDIWPRQTDACNGIAKAVLTTTLSPHAPIKVGQAS